MPRLSDIHYSHNATVTAVRNYYKFLTRMYFDESKIVEPPQDGWPNITPESMRALGKTDEVVSLLRHLPYVTDDMAHGAPWCTFANWHANANRLVKGWSGSSLRLSSEKDVWENVPPHVVSITSGERKNPVFLLDTKLGIIHWYECHGEIHQDPTRELVYDDPYDYAPENEQEWRGESPAWTIPDFFEVLKDQFKSLNSIPTSSTEVVDVYTIMNLADDGMLPVLQKIYREHGWPDLVRYRKLECLEAVRKALKAHYPDDNSYNKH